MIKTVYAHSGLMNNNNFGSSGPYIANNTNDPSHGAVRYRESNFEIYDSFNKTWITYFGETANITLEPRIHILLEWVEQKMQEEHRERKLLETYPALKTAKDNYELIKALIKNENN
jgi:hypothetical protein